MKKADHLECSDGDTLIVASQHCPLETAKPDQLFNDHVCCRIVSTNRDFICPGFYKAVYSALAGFQIDCRIGM